MIYTHYRAALRCDALGRWVVHVIREGMEPPKRRGSLSLEGFGFLRENLIGVFELLTDAFGRRAAE